MVLLGQLRQQLLRDLFTLQAARITRRKRSGHYSGCPLRLWSSTNPCWCCTAAHPEAQASQGNYTWGVGGRIRHQPLNQRALSWSPLTLGPAVCSSAVVHTADHLMLLPPKSSDVRLFCKPTKRSRNFVMGSKVTYRRGKLILEWGMLAST